MHDRCGVAYVHAVSLQWQLRWLLAHIQLNPVIVFAVIPLRLVRSHPACTIYLRPRLDRYDGRAFCAVVCDPKQTAVYAPFNRAYV